MAKVSSSRGGGSRPRPLERMGDALRDALARIGERAVQVEEDGKGSDPFWDGSKNGLSVTAGPGRSETFERKTDTSRSRGGASRASTCGRCGMRPDERRGKALGEGGDVFVRGRHAGVDCVGDPAGEAKAGGAHRVGGEQRVVEAAQAKADHEDHGQAQRARQVARVQRGAERHEETAHALDDGEVGCAARRRCASTRGASSIVASLAGSGDVRRHRLAQQHGRDRLERRRAGPGRPRQRERVLVGPAAPVATRARRPPASSAPRAGPARAARARGRTPPGSCPRRCRCR